MGLQSNVVLHDTVRGRTKMVVCVGVRQSPHELTRISTKSFFVQAAVHKLGVKLTAREPADLLYAQVMLLQLRLSFIAEAIDRCVQKTISRSQK